MEYIDISEESSHREIILGDAFSGVSVAMIEDPKANKPYILHSYNHENWTVNAKFLFFTKKVSGSYDDYESEVNELHVNSDMYNTIKKELGYIY